MSAPEVDFTMHRNDTVHYTVTVKDSAGDAVSLVGAQEITFAMAKKKSDGSFSSTTALTKTMTEGGVVVTDAANGVCRVDIDSNDTESLTPAEYYYEVEVIDSGGAVGTVLIGTITLLKDLILNP